MNPYANEEIMWQRVKDIQREVENSRLLAQGTTPGYWRLARFITRSARGALHALGLTPRWWSDSDVAIAHDDTQADTNAA